MWRAVESGGFVGHRRKSRILRESRNGLRPHPGEPDIPGRAAEGRNATLKPKLNTLKPNQVKEPAFFLLYGSGTEILRR